MSKVLVVDDHPLVRQGLVRILEEGGLQVVGEAATAEEALEAVACGPDLIVWDWTIPGGGAEALEAVRQRYPGAKILVITAFPSPGLVRALRDLGVQGFLPKTASPEEILDACREVLSGGERLPQAPDLSPREREILEGISKGLGNRELAATLGISVKTVENHLERLKAKLGCKSTAELRALALRGLIPR